MALLLFRARGRGPYRREGSEMIIVLKPGTLDGEIEDVCRRIEALGLRAHVSRGEQRTVIELSEEPEGLMEWLTTHHIQHIRVQEVP